MSTQQHFDNSIDVIKVKHWFLCVVSALCMVVTVLFLIWAYKGEKLVTQLQENIDASEINLSDYNSSDNNVDDNSQTMISAYEGTVKQELQEINKRNRIVMIYYILAGIFMFVSVTVVIITARINKEIILHKNHLLKV